MDYRGLEALDTVIVEQSFHRAAKSLYITQSAVSQRIAALEKDYAEPLLIREPPYRPTQLGSLLLGHFQRVQLLESELETSLERRQQQVTLKIALNRDSMILWFEDLFAKLKGVEQTLFELLTDDQEVTWEYMRSGRVLACVTTRAKPLTGCLAHSLGQMKYQMVATPDFIDRFFPRGVTQKALEVAPGVVFDYQDQLHERTLKLTFSQLPRLPCHVVPSVTGFKKMILAGLAYGMMPKMDLSELESGELVEVFPGLSTNVDLFWHHWDLKLNTLESLTAHILTHCKKLC